MLLQKYVLVFWNLIDPGRIAYLGYLQCDLKWSYAPSQPVDFKLKGETLLGMQLLESKTHSKDTSMALLSVSSVASLLPRTHLDPSLDPVQEL